MEGNVMEKVKEAVRLLKEAKLELGEVGFTLAYEVNIGLASGVLLRFQKAKEPNPRKEQGISHEA